MLPPPQDKSDSASIGESRIGGIIPFLLVISFLWTRALVLHTGSSICLFHHFSSGGIPRPMPSERPLLEEDASDQPSKHLGIHNSVAGKPTPFRSGRNCGGQMGCSNTFRRVCLFGSWGETERGGAPNTKPESLGPRRMVVSEPPRRVA
jgi:hypothetical protein